MLYVGHGQVVSLFLVSLLGSRPMEWPLSGASLGSWQKKKITWRALFALKASVEKKREFIITPSFHAPPSIGCLLAIVNIILNNYNDNENN